MQKAIDGIIAIDQNGDGILNTAELNLTRRDKNPANDEFLARLETLIATACNKPMSGHNSSVAGIAPVNRITSLDAPISQLLHILGSGNVDAAFFFRQAVSDRLLAMGDTPEQAMPVIMHAQRLIESGQFKQTLKNLPMWAEGVTTDYSCTLLNEHGLPQPAPMPSPSETVPSKALPKGRGNTRT